MSKLKRRIAAAGIVLSLTALLAAGRSDARAPELEAEHNLSGLFFAALSYWGTFRTYEVPDVKKLGFTVMGFQETGFIPRYTYWYPVKGGAQTVPASVSPDKLPDQAGCDVTTPPTSVAIAATAAAFTAGAKGNLDDDPTCDEWSINEHKQLVHTLDDRNH